MVIGNLGKRLVMIENLTFKDFISSMYALCYN